MTRSMPVPPAVISLLPLLYEHMFSCQVRNMFRQILPVFPLRFLPLYFLRIPLKNQRKILPVHHQLQRYAALRIRYQELAAHPLLDNNHYELELFS